MIPRDQDPIIINDHDHDEIIRDESWIIQGTTKICLTFFLERKIRIIRVIIKKTRILQRDSVGARIWEDGDLIQRQLKRSHYISVE